MPKLKSAVNSFLLTKKRFKRRRKTNKRKRTNRRYKRWMRGGAFASKDKNDSTFIEVIAKLNEDPLPETELEDISKFLEEFTNVIINQNLNKTSDYKITELINKLNDITTKPLHVDDIIRNLTSIDAELKKTDTSPQSGAQSGTGTTKEVLKLILQYNDKSLKSFKLETPPSGPIAGGGRRRR